MKPEGPLRTLPVPVGLVGIAALLTCLYGGFIINDETRLAPGVVSLIQNIFGGSDAPLLGHAVLALPIVLALSINLLSRRVQQVPTQLFTAVWLVFFFFLGASAAFSSFRALSLEVWLEWLVYGCALFTVVACAGRTKGPALILGSVATGCSLLALKGIIEYNDVKGTDATWRIFAGWTDPNATAAMLLLGFFVAVGLCLSRTRVEALLAGIAAAIILFAISLTGSKGTVGLGLPVGTIVLGAMLARPQRSTFPVVAAVCVVALGGVGYLFLKNGGWLGLALSTVVSLALIAALGRPENRRLQVSRMATCYLGALVLISLLAFTAAHKASPAGGPGNPPASAAPSTPIARIGSGEQTLEQSSTFRLNLWKSAINLIKDRPLTGFGMGTYRFESGRAGITTTTVYAHNVYLQLWAECGVFPTLLFLFGIALWLWLVFRNHSRQPPSSLGTSAGTAAAVIALLAHSMVDSDLYYFGIGLVFFMLLGVGLLLNVDAVAPELLPKQARFIATGGAICLLVVMFGFAGADDALGHFRYDMATGDRETLEADAESLGWFAWLDGSADYLQGLLRTGDERVQAFQRAYELEPSEKVARALAAAQADDNKPLSAISTLRAALLRDPDNFSTLTSLMKLQLKAGDTSGAIDTAKRLVAIEGTPYFKIRSIPESVPTETYEARFDVLAPNERDPRKRADLIAEAVRGMLPYGRVTARIIYKNVLDSKDPNANIPGYGTLPEAQNKLEEAAAEARQAAKTYRTVGDTAAAEEMETDGRELDAVLAEISRK